MRITLKIKMDIEPITAKDNFLNNGTPTVEQINPT